MSLIGQAKQTAVQAVHQRLAADILDGRFKPGERLEEKLLAQTYGVSRTPVREALRLLAATGLAEHRPNRGVIVSLPDDAQLAEMFEVLGELEGSCARLSALRMSPSERMRLLSVHRAALEAVQRLDIEAYLPHNRAFHKTIYEGAHNAFLMQTTEGIHTRCAPFRQVQFRIADRLDKSFQEHEAVVDAILAARPEDAYRAMLSHFSVVRAASRDYVHGLGQTGTAQHVTAEAS